MNEKEKFGELAAEALNIGDIVEWSSWNFEFDDWDSAMEYANQYREQVFKFWDIKSYQCKTGINYLIF